MDEMTVRVLDEALHVSVGIDLHMVVDVPQYTSQRNAAESVRVNYGKAWVHDYFCLLPIIDITMRIGNISTRPKNMSIVKIIFTADGRDA